MPNEEGNIMIWGVKTDFYILREKKWRRKLLMSLFVTLLFALPTHKKKKNKNAKRITKLLWN